VSVGHETPSYPLDVEYRTVDGVELVETVESVEGIWVAQRHWWGVSATLVCKSSEKLDIPDKRRRLFERSRGAIARLERVEGRWGGIVKKQHSNVRRMSGKFSKYVIGFMEFVMCLLTIVIYVLFRKYATWWEKHNIGMEEEQLLAGAE